MSNKSDCCYRVGKRKRTEPTTKNPFPHVVEKVRLQSNREIACVVRLKNRIFTYLGLGH